MVALGVSFIICIVWTLIAPDKNDNYDAYKTIEPGGLRGHQRHKRRRPHGHEQGPQGMLACLPSRDSIHAL